MRAFLALVTALALTTASASPIRVAPVFSHVHVAHRACGRPTGPVQWFGLHARQRFQHCTIIGRFSIHHPNRPRPTSTPVPFPTATSTPVPTSNAVRLLGLLNADRAKLGVPALREDPAISNGSGSCVGAIGHARAMLATGTIWHVNGAYPAASFPADACGSYQTAGQNVGMGYGDPWTAVQSLHAAMMAEPGYTPGCQSSHKCNILFAGYSRVGLAVVTGSGATFLVETFEGP